MTTADDAAARSSRIPFDRIGVAVLRELVESIVTGRFAPGDLLPPEGALSADFGVSRTVIRESVKRLQEKGMVTVAQGRGTHVNEVASWNLLDPLVLSTLIFHDDTLGILDDLSVVRGALEAAMAGAVAGRRTDEAVAELRDSVAQMRDAIGDPDAFRAADVQFHHSVMRLSDNILAENIAGSLFDHANESARYRGVNPEDAYEAAVIEHERVVRAIDAGDAVEAQRAMEEHIRVSWERRRPPSPRATGR